jgi:hypothetical protein
MDNAIQHEGSRFIYSSGRAFCFTSESEREDLITRALNIHELIQRAEKRIDSTRSSMKLMNAFLFINKGVYERTIDDLQRAIPRLKIYLNKALDKAKYQFKQISNCCSAPLIPETDLCSKCGEHAEIINE